MICEACWKETDRLFEDQDGNAVCEECLLSDMEEYADFERTDDEG